MRTLEKKKGLGQKNEDIGMWETEEVTYRPK